MRRESRIGFTLVMILLGAFVGSIIGEAVARLVPSLSSAGMRLATVGLTPPFTVDLKVLSLTLGLSLHLNVTGVAGMIVGLIIALRD